MSSLGDIPFSFTETGRHFFPDAAFFTRRKGYSMSISSTGVSFLWQKAQKYSKTFAE
jgi:hypothetical protein